MPYLLLAILLALLHPEPNDCLWVGHVCTQEALDVQQACVAECRGRMGYDEIIAECDESQLQCVRRRFADCLVGPYESNIVIDTLICQEINPPGETWCWFARVATGLDVRAECERSDRDEDGDVDLADYAALQRAWDAV